MREISLEKIKLEGHMLSHMFSYGAYRGTMGSEEFHPSEFRASELKGMMRSLYRMACPAELSALKTAESDLFGGVVGDNDNAGHASPVQLIIKSDGKYCHEELLRHNKKGYNPEMERPDDTWQTFITIRWNKRVAIKDKELAGFIDLNWYKDLIILTLMLCGTGKRSRKGRGRVEFTGIGNGFKYPFTDKGQALQWICGVLNKTAAAGQAGGDCYRLNSEGNLIEPVQPSGELRPLIKKVVLGDRLYMKTEASGKAGEADPSLCCTDMFLSAVDEECHKLALKSTRDKKSQTAINPIGSGRPRFASSLIIGFTRINDDIYPIYTYVKAVVRDKTNNSGQGRFNRRDTSEESLCEIDANCQDRKYFVDNVMDLYNALCGKGGIKT